MSKCILYGGIADQRILDLGDMSLQEIVIPEPVIYNFAARKCFSCEYTKGMPRLTKHHYEYSYKDLLDRTHVYYYRGSDRLRFVQMIGSEFRWSSVIEQEEKYMKEIQRRQKVEVSQKLIDVLCILKSKQYVIEWIEHPFRTGDYYSRGIVLAVNIFEEINSETK